LRPQAQVIWRPWKEKARRGKLGVQQGIQKQRGMQVSWIQGDVVIMPRRTRITRSFWQNGERVVSFFTRPGECEIHFLRTDRKKMDNKIKKSMTEYLIVPKKLAIERLAKWLHDDTARTDNWEDMPNKPKGPDKWGIRRGDGKAYWKEKAEQAIKAMEGKA